MKATETPERAVAFLGRFPKPVGVLADGNEFRDGGLFEEKTYGEAEQCCADLRAVIADQGVTANSLRKFESAYRHLRAFADCAGSEIRRPSGLSRKLGGPSARADHIKHQTGDTKPSSPILDELSKRFASTTGRTD